MQIEWRLKELLEERNMTMTELRQRLEDLGYRVDLSAVSRDMGIHKPLLRKAGFYCDALECGPQNLIVVRYGTSTKANLSYPPEVR